MFKKKQVLVVVGISITCFLIGIMFNVMATDGGNPWNIVWTNINELQGTVEALEAKVETLEGQLPQQGFLTAPAYDSGWVFSNEPTVLNHNLGTTEVFVYLVGKTTEGITHYYYGQDIQWWSLTSTHIKIHAAAASIQAFRVMIWKISES